MTIFLSVLFLVLVASPPASAYGGDTHYYMRFAIALETCFDWDEAHLIASADYLVDKNRATTAEKHPLKQYNKIHWHAFGHNEERYNFLWERVLAEKDPELQLVKLGQFTHFISDWEAHFGFGVRMGHGLPTIKGKDPDSLANNRMNNYRMIGQTLTHMIEVCTIRGRTVGHDEDPERFLAEVLTELRDEPLMEELYEYNSRKWKNWGIRGKKGKAILAENHRLIENLIQRRSIGHPERKIPSDFQPGDPEHGIPPPIGLKYNKKGDLLKVYGVEVELSPEYMGAEMSAVEEETFEG
jgi:hypothetical protein